jgi:uncharacterized protein
VDFEWDAAKAAGNRRKHGVSFEEASTVFDDPKVLVRYDEGHSDEEDRWNAAGMSEKLRVLSVTYTRRGSAIRIISARKATRAESREYGES